MHQRLGSREMGRVLGLRTNRPSFERPTQRFPLPVGRLRRSGFTAQREPSFSSSYTRREDSTAECQTARRYAHSARS